MKLDRLDSFVQDAAHPPLIDPFNRLILSRLLKDWLRRLEDKRGL